MIDDVLDSFKQQARDETAMTGRHKLDNTPDTLYFSTILLSGRVRFIQIVTTY
jgi:hypothetical protein